MASKSTSVSKEVHATSPHHVRLRKMHSTPKDRVKRVSILHKFKTKK